MTRFRRVAVCLLVLSFLCVSSFAAEKTYQLVLLRHGESTWNKEGKFTGWSDVPLTEKGEAGALRAGRLMKEAGLSIDAVYTSRLGRAIKTSWLALEGMEKMWTPVTNVWWLNERCYGDLEGKTHAEATAESGEAQVKIWRRSFDVPPPPIPAGDPRSPLADARYDDVPRFQLPLGESLEMVIKRLEPYWSAVLVPEIVAGKNILISGHSTQLRALSALIDPSLDVEALGKLEISNSTPIVYTLDENLRPISRTILGGKK